MVALVLVILDCYLHRPAQPYNGPELVARQKRITHMPQHEVKKSDGNSFPSSPFGPLSRACCALAGATSNMHNTLAPPLNGCASSEQKRLQKTICL